MFEFTWDFAPALHVMGYPLRIYGLIYAALFLIAWQLIDWQIKRRGGTDRETTILMILSFVGIWFGGRLGHFGFYETELLLKNPLILFEVSRGGIASHGSIAFVSLLFFGFSRFKKTSFIDLLDRMAFPMALGAGLIRIGNLFNSEIVGRLTDQTWGVRFPIYDYGKEIIPLRHPSQIYEAIIGFTLFTLLFILDRKLGKEARPIGVLAGFAWLFYGLARFIVEYWKAYQTLSANFSLTMGQLLSFVPITMGLGMLYYAFRFHRKDV